MLAAAVRCYFLGLVVVDAGAVAAGVCEVTGGGAVFLGRRGVVGGRRSCRPRRLRAARWALPAESSGWSRVQRPVSV